MREGLPIAPPRYDPPRYEAANLSSSARPSAPAQPPWTALIASAAAVVVLAGGVAAVHQFRGGPSDAGTAAGAEVVARKAAKPRSVAQGTVTEDANFAFKVTELTRAGRTLGSGPEQVKADGRFIVIHLAVKNLGSERQPLLPTTQRLHDSSGAVYTADTSAPSARSRRLWSGVAPGREVAGIMVFDVPTSARITSIELHGSGLSTGVDVKLKD